MTTPLWRGERQRILLVDDSAVHRVAMATMLERAGFEVIVGTNGRDAVRLVREQQPDALVIDALMPVMGGFDAIAEIRAGTDATTLPTLVVSGLDDIDSRVRALEIGADDFLTKPIHADELTARVRAQLRHAAAWATQAQGPSGAANPSRVAEQAWLDRVVEHRDFDLHFQPIIDITTGRIDAEEALVRFRDGHTPLDVFNREETLERVVELELAIVAVAVAEAHRLPPGVAVHINVTPTAALDDRLPVLLEPADRRVVLEITENDRFNTADAAVLRSRLPTGCQIAADDVGAGFSGLSQLLGVRPEVVKIDRELVKGLQDDPARQVVVAGLVRFAEATGATLIAEGIEEPDESDALVRLGVRLGQGYLFGRPAPVTELAFSA